MTKFELTILGTSSALPTIQRYPTAQVLNVHERFFLIDCGEGTQIQLKKNHIKCSRINHIFISHLHGDHYFGLIGLISTFILLGRQNDLHIYSHSLLPELLKPQLEFMTNGGAEMYFKIIWHPLHFKKPMTIFEDNALSVTSFPLKHRIPCCGFLFMEKPKELNLNKGKVAELQIPIRYLHLIKNGADYCTPEGDIIPNKALTLPPLPCRSYAFCTDTRFLPGIADWIRKVDLLYHEATYDHTLMNQAEATTHSTARQAAQLALLASVGKLLIGHFSARYKNLDCLLNEAREIFPNTELANEGSVHPILLDRNC